MDFVIPFGGFAPAAPPDQLDGGAEASETVVGGFADVLGRLGLDFGDADVPPPALADGGGSVDEADLEQVGDARKDSDQALALAWHTAVTLALPARKAGSVDVGVETARVAAPEEQDEERGVTAWMAEAPQNRPSLPVVLPGIAMNSKPPEPGEIELDVQAASAAAARALESALADLERAQSPGATEQKTSIQPVDPGQFGAGDEIVAEIVDPKHLADPKQFVDPKQLADPAAGSQNTDRRGRTDAPAPTAAVVPVQARELGNGSPTGGATAGDGNSARQEQGQRAYAAAASLEPARVAKDAAAISSDTRAVTATPAVSPGRVDVVRSPDGPAPSRTADGEVVPQLVSAMRTQFRNGIGEARIRLNPDHLGSVQIDLKIDGGRVSAVLQVERADVRQAIESQSDSLRTQLAGQGLTLESLTVRDDGRFRAERDSADGERGGHQPPQERRQRKRQTDKEFDLGDEP